MPFDETSTPTVPQAEPEQEVTSEQERPLAERLGNSAKHSDLPKKIGQVAESESTMVQDQSHLETIQPPHQVGEVFQPSAGTADKELPTQITDSEGAMAHEAQGYSMKTEEEPTSVDINNEAAEAQERLMSQMEDHIKKVQSLIEEYRESLKKDKV
jgi:hypothetical protein